MHRFAGLIAASLAVAVAVAVSGCRSPADSPPVPPAAPAVVALPADAVTPSSAALHATVDPAGSAAQGWFEWAADPALAAAAETVHVGLGSGTGPVPLSEGVEGLAPGTTYWFRAAATGAGGTTRGEVLSFTTPFHAPLVATLPADPPGTATASLHGTVDPRGSAGEAWFEWGSDPALATAAETPRGAVGSGTGAVAVSATLEALAPGTTYWFRAAGSSAGGTARGEILALTTAVLAPRPVTLLADPVGVETATLHGTVDPSGSAAEGWFEWGCDPSLASAVETERLALGSGTFPVPLSTALGGLAPGTTYWFRAAAAGAGGTVKGEIQSFTTARLAPQVVTLPADPIGAGTATLNGTVDPRGSETDGWFEWGTDPSLATAADTAHVALGSGAGPVAVSAALDGLAPGTTYWFRAAASNAGGTLRGEIRSLVPGFAAPRVTTLPPDEVTASSATLHAEIDGAGLEAEGWFEWSTDPAFSSSATSAHVLLAVGSGAVPISLPLSGLSPGQTYCYRAVASSAAGTTVGAAQWFGTDTLDPYRLVVNSLEDLETPPAGKLTLRAAIARIPWGGTIAFAGILDGGTIALSTVGDAHSVLQGEVYAFDAVNRTWVYEGFQDRDFGRSALYAVNSFTIDASDLPNGITVAWAGGDANPARVLAVYGDLTLHNVSITSGHAVAEPIPEGPQPWTLARGGGLAVWGTATLRNCTVSGNRVTGDSEPSRDRGAFGGGIYADTLVLEDSIVSGNSATGFGAAGGGIYSVGGIYGPYGEYSSSLTRCSVTGNRVTGQHAYGGGIFSDGGGTSHGDLPVTNCTIARNVVEDHPGIADSAMFQYYARGGGIYASNGTVRLVSSTVVENAVTGHAATFAGRPNLGGGGVGGTIGDAHVTEAMHLQHSVVAGNTLNGAAEDVYTGSLIDFWGLGYDLVGRLDFSRMLVPVPEWQCLSRKHWPKVEDRDGVALADAVDVGGAHRSASIVSVGTDAGERAVLWYEPGAAAIGRVPADAYPVSWTWIGYDEFGVPTDDFLNHLLAEVRSRYGDVLGQDFGARFGDLTGTTYYGPAYEWPSNPENAAWIAFWRDLDAELAGRLGQTGLGDDFWASFPTGQVGNEWVYLYDPQWSSTWVSRAPDDQLGNVRPPGANGAVGAVEASTPSPFWARAESGAAP